MRSPTFASALVAAITVAAPGQAREIDYEAPSGCPGRQAVAARVERAASGGRPVGLVISRFEDGFVGRVTLGEGDDATTRTVGAQTCGAVVDALALVVALDEPPPRSTEAGPPTPVATTSTTSAAIEQAEPAPVTPPDDAPKTPAEASRLIDHYTGLLATGMGYPNDGALIGGAAFFEAGLAGPSWYWPSARLLVARTLAQRPVFTTQSYSFQLTTAAFEPCPVGAGTGSGALRVSACARAEVGAVEVMPFEGASATRLWAALGGTLRVRVAFAQIEGTRLAFEAGGGVLAPLVRDRFVAPDDDVVARPSTSVWVASLGVGAILP